ncbi:MAG: hypothetical protein D3919_12915 [Candidatus Electrothrix sp. AW5]|nr:hypothetical protein [Candidatus Electrothrix gigas]
MSLWPLPLDNRTKSHTPYPFAWLTDSYWLLLCLACFIVSLEQGGKLYNLLIKYLVKLDDLLFFSAGK